MPPLAAGKNQLKGPGHDARHLEVASHMIWAVLDWGGLTYRSSTLRYLRTVGSLTFSLRAIEAMDSPFLRRERIDCIWGMLIIAFPDLSRMELEAHQAKAHGWSACLSA